MTPSAPSFPGLRDAFGHERYEQALGTARVWLLRSVFDQIAAQDPLRLAELAPEEALLVQQALLVADLIALENLDEAEAALGSAEGWALRTACAEAFYLARALPEPADPEQGRKGILRLVCYAVLGDRTGDARRWLRERGLPEVPLREDLPWPRKVFSVVADAFLRCIRKDGWADLHEVARAIAQLRALQQGFEADFLESLGEERQVGALELVAMYHLARAVEFLATFSGKGTPRDILDELRFHFFRAIRAASTGGMMELELLLRWLRAASMQVVRNSIWWLLRSFNSRISEHVRHLVSEDAAKPLFELLPPQRRALLEDGLLDPAHRAVVVQMPTSSGKTLLAEFRVLQALNSFPNCWVAYLAPTRALVNQVALRLRKDLAPLGIKVESAAPVQEIDIFEEEWLASSDAQVVVTTPEKLDLLIRGRNGPPGKPLGLVILDEAHNIGEGERGVRAELLLALLNQEHPDVQFLLLTPFVPNSHELAAWLDPQRSKAISVLAADWQPNDRVIGLTYVEGSGRDWTLAFRTLHSLPANIESPDALPLGPTGTPLDMTASAARASKSKVAAATAKVLSRREGSSCVVLASSPGSAWDIAGLLEPELPIRRGTPRLDLVRRFAETEVSPDFKLCRLLDRGIAVHHGGLSPDLRFLVEWLTEEGDVSVLVATTTLAQGVNFPVSSIVLASHHQYQPYRGNQPMSASAFQNLAGRAGRLFQDTLGIVAFAAQEEMDPRIVRFVASQVEELASALEQMVNEVLDRGWELNLTSLVRNDPRWSSFVQYLAHAYRQAGDHFRFLADTEKLLLGTWGYRRLQSTRPTAAAQLIDASRRYAETLKKMGAGVLTLVDSTGFSAETVRDLLEQQRQLPRSAEEWSPSRLFRRDATTLADLCEVLLSVPELKLELPPGRDRHHLAQVLAMWAEGRPLGEIAASHFSSAPDDTTAAITDCCRALFQKLAQNGAWGLGALQSMARVDVEQLNPSELEAFKSVPAMIFYGVPTVNGVLMRTLGVPRSIAVAMGERYSDENRRMEGPRVSRARNWLERQPAEVWDEARSPGARLSGQDFRTVWRVLNGMES